MAGASKPALLSCRLSACLGMLGVLFLVQFWMVNRSSSSFGPPVPLDDDWVIRHDDILPPDPVNATAFTHLHSNSDCTVTPSRILGERPIVARIATVLTLSPSAYDMMLKDWEENHQLRDIVRFFARPQGFEIVLLFDRHSYPGYGTNYLKILDAVDLVPADKRTREIVAADREKQQSKHPWDDPIDVVSLNFTYNGVIIRIAHIRLPFHEAPGLSVKENNESGLLEVNYDGERIPDYCKSSPWYVLGVKSYTTPEFWRHPLISQSDYLMKMDLDVWFFGHIPFRITEDMELRGALIGHTGAQNLNPNEKGNCNVDKTCDHGYKEWMETTWKQLNIVPCASKNPQFADGGDLFYTNVIVFKTELFRHPQVLQFIEEIGSTPLWWKHRWGDQVFFHHALGILTEYLNPYVVDYTEFRCFANDYWDWFENTTSLEEKCKKRSFTHKRRVHQKFHGSLKSPEEHFPLSKPFPLSPPLCNVI